MRYQHALFQRISTLDYSQRHRLYLQASQFAQQGADTLITYEDSSCHLWLNLRHKSSAIAEQQPTPQIGRAHV